MMIGNRPISLTFPSRDLVQPNDCKSYKCSILFKIIH